jgi:hypothetical protein
MKGQWSLCVPGIQMSCTGFLTNIYRCQCWTGCVEWRLNTCGKNTLVFIPADWDILCKLSEYWYFQIDTKLKWKNKGQHVSKIILLFLTCLPRRSQWPRGLRRGCAIGRLLGLRVRIPPGAWTSVSCECCVLSGRGLCVWPIGRPEESYRVWSWRLDNEEALAHWGLLHHGKKCLPTILIYLNMID